MLTPRGTRARMKRHLGMAPKRKLGVKVKCAECGKKFALPARGRLPEYCSQTCRQRAYEARKWQEKLLPHGVAPALLQKDLVPTLNRAFIKELVREILVEEGPPAVSPPAKHRKPQPRHLRLVEKVQQNEDPEKSKS
jgi:hypothetical protein